jgi:hypothetical protein
VEKQDAPEKDSLEKQKERERENLTKGIKSALENIDANKK